MVDELPFSERAKSFIALIAKDGGSNAYNQWACNYEADSSSMNYSGNKSVVSKWMTYHSSLLESPPGTKQHKVFDAGCGTGLVGELLSKSVTLESSSNSCIELHGCDVSSEMLKIAKSKAVYADLKEASLKEILPYEENSFDSAVCAGVFGVGHCGPECVPNIIRVLKPNCNFIATINKELFLDKIAQEWRKQIEKSSCELIECSEMPYRDHAAAVVVVIRKLPAAQ